MYSGTRLPGLNCLEIQTTKLFSKLVWLRIFPRLICTRGRDKFLKRSCFGQLWIKLSAVRDILESSWTLLKLALGQHDSEHFYLTLKFNNFIFLVNGTRFTYLYHDNYSIYIRHHTLFFLSLINNLQTITFLSIIYGLYSTNNCF